MDFSNCGAFEEKKAELGSAKKLKITGPPKNRAIPKNSGEEHRFCQVEGLRMGNYGALCNNKKDP
jgi:hypothetical protein